MNEKDWRQDPVNNLCTARIWWYMDEGLHSVMKIPYIASER
jgi:hypothetical protein